MRILIEEYKYRANDVREILHGVDALETIEGYVSLNYVGYFYNPTLCDCVFILPKVLLETKDKIDYVFGKYKPEDILDVDGCDILTEPERNFIYEFAVWIYRAIVVFKNTHKDSDIVFHKKIIQVGKGQRKLSNTFLDILLALLEFNKDNQSFFFFVLKNLHSGYNKINWTRTIATSSAIVQDNRPVYLNPVNKKRQINFDEELLVIFFSILNYISEHYGFAVDINCNFNLIKGKQFKVYLDGLGKARLQQIKYKYFSDKALELWNLCYAFFDTARQVRTNSTQREYLLVKNFNIVFEAIIDELVGDDDIPKALKEQEDGKRVDHMYTYKGLTTYEEDKPIYYIGDSKYYKRGNQVGKESVYKQFTYARNVIQWNLNLFMNVDTVDSEWMGKVPMLRDDVTEGYNIIPNFFISARLNNELSYKEDIEITEKKKTYFTNRQFENRLFDRDTMLVCHYDVNFLFVLSLYARNNTIQKDAWKVKVREMFRTEIQKILSEKFGFYAMAPRLGVNAESYIKEHFQDVLGKMYAPYSNRRIFSLALEKGDKYKEDNDTLLAELRRYFYIEPCGLGENPQNVLPELSAPCYIDGFDDALALLITKEGIHFDNAIQLLQETQKVGVALKMDGAVLQLVEGFTKAKYLIIHNKGDRYEVYGFDGAGPRLVHAGDAEHMVVTKQDEQLYLVYQIDLRLKFYLGELDFSAATKGGNGYNPQLLPVSKLVKKDN